MTIENSRADALTEKQRHAVDEAAKVLRDNWEHGTAEDLLMAFLPESSDPQPAAAPVPEDCDVRNILLDVVPGEDGEGQEVYARNVADVERLLSEMGEKLDAAGAANQPAPSPADGRAAFDSEIGSVIADAATRGIAWMSFKAGIAYARAAYANETVAEGATCCKRQMDNGDPVEPQCYECEERAICKRDESSSPAMAPEAVAVPAGWKLVPIEPTVSMLVDGFESWPDPIFSTPEEWGAFEKMTGCQQATHKARLCYSAMLTAAPQPAQADARVGLTGEQPLDDATQRPLYKAAFNYRHEFDIFPNDELRSGAFNEFVAGWYAALTQGRNK